MNVPNPMADIPPSPIADHNDVDHGQLSPSSSSLLPLHDTVPSPLDFDDEDVNAGGDNKRLKDLRWGDDAVDSGGNVEVSLL